ncbi:MAG: hypothetical protein IT531_25030 [Burkholderiales bacterium]|nr:hypothetical protein [Burkholderiales bacterium]
MPKMTGSRLVAEMLKGYGVTHVFFVPTMLMEALAEMDSLGVQTILTHGEKAAAYMADGTRARRTRRAYASRSRSGHRTSRRACAIPTWRILRSSPSPAARRRTGATAMPTRRWRIWASSTA